MKKLKKHLKTIGAFCLAFVSCFMLAGCDNSSLNVDQTQVDSLIETVNTTDEKLAEVIDAIKNNKLNLDELYKILNEQNKKINTTDAYNMALNAEVNLANFINKESNAYKIEITDLNNGLNIIDEYFVKSGNNKTCLVVGTDGEETGQEIVYYSQIKDDYAFGDSWSSPRFYNSYKDAIELISSIKDLTKIREYSNIKDFSVDDIINVEILENGNVKVTMYKNDTSNFVTKVGETETTHVKNIEHIYIVELTSDGLIDSILQCGRHTTSYKNSSTPYYDREFNIYAKYTYGLSQEEINLINETVQEFEDKVATEVE